MARYECEDIPIQLDPIGKVRLAGVVEPHVSAGYHRNWQVAVAVADLCSEPQNFTTRKK